MAARVGLAEYTRPKPALLADSAMRGWVVSAMLLDQHGTGYLAIRWLIASELLNIHKQRSGRDSASCTKACNWGVQCGFQFLAWQREKEKFAKGLAAATKALSLAFLQQVFTGDEAGLLGWPQRYAGLVSRFAAAPAPGR